MTEKTRTELESNKKGYTTIFECDCRRNKDGDVE
jgi:hypothetical protein